MTDRELMQMALDALKEYVGVVVSVNDPNDWTPKVADAGEPARKAIEALRARLAQPEPEPVAVVGVDLSKVHMYVGHNYVGLKPKNKTAIFFKDVPEGTPLYTAPPQREWQGLTDEEIENCFEMSMFGTCRAIEAKLKEKNG